MKNFLEFILEAKSYSNSLEITSEIEISPEQIRENYISGSIFKEGSLVQKNDTGEIGRIVRRGTNHLICVNESGTMFRVWITDVKEVFEIGTCEYRAHAQKYTPGQPLKSFSGKIKIKSSYK